MDQVMCQAGIIIVLGSAKGSRDFNRYDHLSISAADLPNNRLAPPFRVGTPTENPGSAPV